MIIDAHLVGMSTPSSRLLAGGGGGTIHMSPGGTWMTGDEAAGTVSNQFVGLLLLVSISLSNFG